MSHSGKNDQCNDIATPNVKLTGVRQRAAAGPE